MNILLPGKASEMSRQKNSEDNVLFLKYKIMTKILCHQLYI